jgi:hypothetical protein
LHQNQKYIKQIPLKDVAEEKPEESIGEGMQFSSVYWQPFRNGWCYTQQVMTVTVYSNRNRSCG